MKNKTKKITPTGVEHIALKKLKDTLTKNGLDLRDISMDDIRKRYKTFDKSITSRTRTLEEVEEMISNYFGTPAEVLRRATGSAFDVDEGYTGTTRAYVRVSSAKELERQDTARQKRDLAKIGYDVLYEDYSSGTREDRVEYNRMIRECKTQDTIICTEISRLSRSSLHLIKLLEDIEKNKMCLKAGTLVFDCRNDEVDTFTKGMIQMMSVFANIERDLISQRTKSGVENAKARGKIVGRPTMTADQLPMEFVNAYYLYRDQDVTGRKYNLEQISNLCNCGNRKTIGKYVQIAKKFEKETGERIEDFRKRIKDKEEFKKWKMTQILNSAFDIDVNEIENNEE